MQFYCPGIFRLQLIDSEKLDLTMSTSSTQSDNLTLCDNIHWIRKDIPRTDKSRIDIYYGIDDTNTHTRSITSNNVINTRLNLTKTCLILVGRFIRKTCRRNGKEWCEFNRD